MKTFLTRVFNRAPKMNVQSHSASLHDHFVKLAMCAEGKLIHFVKPPGSEGLDESSPEETHLVLHDDQAIVVVRGHGGRKVILFPTARGSVTASFSGNPASLSNDKVVTYQLQQLLDYDILRHTGVNISLLTGV